jgi:hypothetical protein
MRSDLSLRASGEQLAIVDGCAREKGSWKRVHVEYGWDEYRKDKTVKEG